MAGAIKGITIEFRGNTTSLDKALDQVKKEAKATANELKYIDKAIKFNPTSVDAWRQKQIVLNKAIGETEEKLKLMKTGLKEMEAKGLNAENSEEFRRMQREIDQTERHLKSLKAELKGIGNVNLKAASEQFKKWGDQLEKAGQSMREVSMAAGAVAASIGALSVKSGKWADNLNTMSKRYGVGTQELQKYSLAADLVDVSTEAIVKSQTKLKKSMLSAEQGSKNQAAAFEKLGVEFTNADGSLRDGETVWQETIAALGEMTNETERDALAMQLMGKSANELNPLIEDGGESYKRLSETMQKYGLDFIDQETLDKANEFNDELDTIKAIGLVTFQSLGTQLAGYLAPALGKVVEWVGKFAEWMSKLSPTVLAVVAGVSTFVAALAPALIFLGKISTGIGALLNVVNKILPVFGLLKTALVAIWGVFGWWTIAIAAVVAAGVWVYKNWDMVKAKALELWEALKTAFSGIKDFMISVWEGIKTAVSAAWDFIVSIIQFRINLMRTIITTVFNGIQTFTRAAWETIKTLIINPIQKVIAEVQSKLNTLRNNITNAFNNIKSTASNAWNAIKTAMINPVQEAVDKIKAIVNKIKGFFPISVGKIFSNIKLPHFSISGKLSVNPPSVPKINVDWYAQGGIFDSPTIAGIGEAGAEAVVPLDKFWKTLEQSNQKTDSLLIAQNRILIEMLSELQKDKDIKIDGRVAGRMINDLVRV